MMFRSICSALVFLIATATAHAQLLEVRYFGTLTSVDEQLDGGFAVGESVELYQSFDTAGGFDVFDANVSLDATRFNSINSGFIFGGDYVASNTSGAPYAEFWDTETRPSYFANTGQGASFSTNFFGNPPPDVAGAQWRQISTYIEVPSGSFSGTSDPEDVISASEILSLNGMALT